jgi:hypothetical protein
VCYVIVVVREQYVSMSMYVSVKCGTSKLYSALCTAT